MNDLSEGARTLLAQASDGLDPSTTDEARVKAGLLARLALPVAAGAVATAAASATAAAASSAAPAASGAMGGAGAAAAGTAAGVGLGLKLAIGSVLLAATAAGGVSVYTSVSGGTPGVPPAPALTMPAEGSAGASSPTSGMDAPGTPSSPVAVPGDFEHRTLDRWPLLPPAPATPGAVPAAALAPRVRAAAEAPDAKAPDTRAGAGMAGRGPALASSPAAPSLADPRPDATMLSAGLDDPPDLALLKEAWAASAEGDLARALALLDEHAARFPDSALVEERLSARARTLCALGRTTEGRASVAALAARNARSPYLALARSDCHVAGEP